jgi:hypothetical protein
MINQERDCIVRAVHRLFRHWASEDPYSDQPQRKGRYAFREHLVIEGMRETDLHQFSAIISRNHPPRAVETPMHGLSVMES